MPSSARTFFAPRGSRRAALRLRRAGGAVLLVLSCALLSACGPEVRGSPKPPPSFGPAQSAWWGCPALQGVYAWPPVADTAVPAGAAARRTPGTGELPFHTMGAEMQVWLRQERGETTVRTRAINRARNVRTAMTRQWSLATYGPAQMHCSGGLLDLEPSQPPDRAEGGDPGKGVLQGFRLVPLKDGALAVGTRRRVPGGSGAYFSWGGQSYGRYDLPDADVWTWAKLARTDPGDREPAVIDAYVPGATAP